MESRDEEEDAARNLAALSRASSPVAEAGYWRDGGAPADPKFLSGAGAGPFCPPGGAPPFPHFLPLRDPALYGPNPAPASGTQATPPPPEIMANEASSAVNRRIELTLLHNEVATAQSLLVGAKAGAKAGGGGGGGAASAAAGGPQPLLERLIPDPVFQSACASVGVPAAAFGAGGAGAAGEREEVDLIKKLAQVLTQMRTERVAPTHTHGTRNNKW